MGRRLSIVLLAALFCIPLAAGTAEDGVSPGMAVFQNIFPGFGVGSLAQHDALAGSILLTADAGAGLLVAIGIVLQYWTPASPGTMDPSDIFIVTGMCVYAGAKLLGIIFPLLHEAFRNPPVPADSGGAPSPTSAITVQPGVVRAGDGRPALGITVHVAFR